MSLANDSTTMKEEAFENDVLDAFGGLSLKECKYEDVYEDEDDVTNNQEEEFATASGNLFMMDDTGSLELEGENIVMVLVRCDEFEYEMRLWRGKDFISSVPVDNSMQPTFEPQTNAIEWITIFDERVWAWRFQFDDVEVSKEFKKSFTVALMENGRQTKFSDIVNEEEAKWVEDGYFEEDKDLAEEDEGDFDNRDNFDFDTYEPYKSPTKQESKDQVNKNLNISKCRNRTFVFNGSTIDVFKHNEDDQLEYVNKTTPLCTLDGDQFAPSHTMLHESDNKMLLLNPNEHDRVFVMDLDREKIVDEWHAGANANFNIRNIAPYTKYAQLTDQKVLTGVSYNGLFLMDPRVNGQNKMTHNYFYQSSPKFSCLATTGDGHVVVGDRKGEIRMFKGVNQKRAKTKLPGLGDGITGIDVTQNGEWILATTPNYLLLILTKIKGDSKNRTGFQVGMGKRKRKPIKLQLSHQDQIKYNIREVNFKSASFNTGDGIAEEWIVTSTGPYLITWNFKKLQRGIREYRIKRTGQEKCVVDAKFRYAKQDNVVVNMPHDIYTEKIVIK